MQAHRSPVPPRPRPPAASGGCPARRGSTQGNNHHIKLTYDRANGYWKAKAYSEGELQTSSSEVAFTSFTPRLVKFIITWYDDTAGIYTATHRQRRVRVGHDPRPLQPEVEDRLAHDQARALHVALAESHSRTEGRPAAALRSLVTSDPTAA